MKNGRAKLGTPTAIVLLWLGGALSAGCSDGGGGDDASPATISGYVSNQSSARHVRPPRTLLASWVDALVPGREAYAGRSGILVSADGEQAVSDGFGFFVLETDGGGVKTVTFDNGSGTFSRDVFAPRTGAVMLAGVSLQSDGSAPSAGTFFALNGRILGANCGVDPRTLTVETPDTVTMSLADDAEIITGEGITCEALNASIGDFVFARGVDAGGGMIAAWVLESGSTPEGLTQFRGQVSTRNCSISLGVTRDDGEGVLVNVTGTSYRSGFTECDDVAVGQTIHVIGEPRPGEVLARWIFPG